MLQSCFSSISSPALQILLGLVLLIDFFVMLFLIWAVWQNAKAVRSARRRLDLDQDDKHDLGIGA